MGPTDRSSDATGADGETRADAEAAEKAAGKLAREEQRVARQEAREEKRLARQEAKAEAHQAEHPTHTVKPGDTLSAIGATYGVSSQEIAKLNHIENPDLIYPGQVFKLPHQ